MIYYPKDSLKDKYMIEVNDIKDLVPKSQRSMITGELVDKLNRWNEDPLLVESFKENIVSYIGVLRSGKYKLEDYMSAVRFVSYKLVGFNDVDAYQVTFPERYKKLEDSGLSRSKMSPYVSAYKKNKLVNAVFEQTIVPSHVLNAPLYQEALNELAYLMVNAKSEVAKVQAATSILTHTKAPETHKIELDIGIAGNSALDDLNEQLEMAAKQQLDMLESGAINLKQLGALKPKDDEFIDVEIDDE